MPRQYQSNDLDYAKYARQTICSSLHRYSDIPIWSSSMNLCRQRWYCAPSLCPNMMDSWVNDGLQECQINGCIQQLSFVPKKGEPSLLSSVETIMSPLWHWEAKRITGWGTERLKQFSFFCSMYSTRAKDGTFLSWWDSSSWGFNGMLFYIVIQKRGFQIFHILPENQGNSFHSVKVYLCKECRIRRAFIRKTMTEILTQSFITNVRKPGEHNQNCLQIRLYRSYTFTQFLVWHVILQRNLNTNLQSLLKKYLAA